MAYGQRLKFFRAEHLTRAKYSATAEGENCAYGPTLPGLYTQIPTENHLYLQKGLDSVEIFLSRLVQFEEKKATR